MAYGSYPHRKELVFRIVLVLSLVNTAKKID